MYRRSNEYFFNQLKCKPMCEVAAYFDYVLNEYGENAYNDALCQFWQTLDRYGR